MKEGVIEQILGHKNRGSALQLYVKYVDEPVSACRFVPWYKADREVLDGYLKWVHKYEIRPNLIDDGV